jgi:hypothetical protein
MLLESVSKRRSGTSLNNRVPEHCFYHHVQSPVIRGLKAEFIEQLTTCRVPFVLQVRREYEDIMTGVGTSNRFEELDRVLSERYQSVHEGKTFRLLRLKRPDGAIDTSNGIPAICLPEIRRD